MNRKTTLQNYLLKNINSFNILYFFIIGIILFFIFLMPSKNVTLSFVS